MGAKKVVLMLSYPSDEVGNELVSLDQVDEAGINPYSDVLTLEKTGNCLAKISISLPVWTMWPITAISSVRRGQRWRSYFSQQPQDNTELYQKCD